MNPIANISGRPLYALLVRANFKVTFTDMNKIIGTAMVQICPKSAPKLSMAKGRINTARGITTRRLCVLALFFFRTPLVKASVIPAVRKPNIVS